MSLKESVINVLRLKRMADDLKLVCKIFVNFVDFMRFQMIS